MRPTGRELEDLIAPLGVRDFIAEHWNNRPLYVEGDPGRFAVLGIDLAVIEGLLRAPPRPDRLRVRYVGPEEEGAPDTRLCAPPQDLASFSVRRGDVTVCLDWISDRLESLGVFCAGVRLSLNLPGSVFMTCYASPAGHGFGTHFDCHPSFILQLEGAKRWRYSARPGLEWPPANLTRAATLQEMRERYGWLPPFAFPDATEESQFLERVLRPGDLLFLPAGTWHHAEAADWSLALTMSYEPRTAVDLVDDFLRARLSSAVEWRMSVPPVNAGAAAREGMPAEVRRFLTGRIAELKRLVRGLNVEELHEAWAHHVHAIDTPFLIDDGLPAKIRPSTLFRRCPDFDMHYICDATAHSVTLYHRDRRIDFRIEALPLVQSVVRGAAFTGTQAVDWLGCVWADAKPMLETMITSGVLVVDNGS